MIFEIKFNDKFQNSHNRKLKIAVIHNQVRQYRIPLFKKLAQEYDVEFFIFDESKRKIEEIRNELNARIYKVGLFRLIKKLSRSEFDVFINPDFVSLEALMSAIVSKIRNVPLVQWTEIWDWPGFNLSHYRFYKRRIKFIIKLSDTFIVPGNNQKKFLINNGVDPSKIFLARNAPNLSDSKISKMKDFKISDKKYVILYLGQIIKRKGIHDALKAISILEKERDDFEFIIGGAGDKKYEKFLKEFTVRSKLKNVKFLGWIDNKLLSSLYERADIFITPSLYDPYPLSIAEALSHGTPVIISNAVGEANDIIKNGENGYIVPINDPKSIYYCLSDFFSNPNKQKMMGAKAKKTYKNKTTYYHMMEGFKNAINLAIKKPK